MTTEAMTQLCVGKKVYWLTLGKKRHFVFKKLRHTESSCQSGLSGVTLVFSSLYSVL